MPPDGDNVDPQIHSKTETRRNKVESPPDGRKFSKQLDLTSFGFCTSLNRTQTSETSRKRNRVKDKIWTVQLNLGTKLELTNNMKTNRRKLRARRQITDLS